MSDTGKITVRKFSRSDVPDMIRIWNSVVEEGIAFPQTEELNEASGEAFFAGQTYSAVAEDTASKKIVGLYILHPNNIGRCGHIANASYAVDGSSRGMHIGEKLVSDCIGMAGKKGFRILQFNAVVRTNVHARHLYERLGFRELGTIPGGFLMKDGHYEDICLYFRTLPATE
jgi:ribosomal protein S18 acetylase RimI-like enzyme